ncbi:unnamed protein product [Medioppia subpectinata]|uniref:Exosome complex component N-terminal domain-containing protein n=1 Tax=Medioppia subpectinata TaxID=1979941 RepID=A0A7R9KBG7_9ACAR|nr:unnamed protein product [Medioppia subpectinata]CAG2100392.1 unnamed protein product [Medioppia subpectinata]
MERRLDCIPGDCLAKSDEWTTGLKGTYSRNGYIYASIAGTVKIVHNDDNTKTLEVLRVDRNRHLVPQMDSIVTCRVLSMTASVVCIA